MSVYGHKTVHFSNGKKTVLKGQVSDGGTTIVTKNGITWRVG